jgi:hypothetical protein
MPILNCGFRIGDCEPTWNNSLVETIRYKPYFNPFFNSPGSFG